MIERMNNGYIPKIGEKIKFVGNCHPRVLGCKAEITNVYKRTYEGEERTYIETKRFDPGLMDVVYSGGICGGVEPWTDSDSDNTIKIQLQEFADNPVKFMTKMMLGITRRMREFKDSPTPSNTEAYNACLENNEEFLKFLKLEKK